MESCCKNVTPVTFQRLLNRNSHPNHDAYFSDEDKAFASPFGEPTFPGTAQLVVAIYDRTVKEIGVFAWSEQEKDFIKVALTKT